MDSDINHIIQMSLNGDKNYHEILLQKLKPLIFRNIYTYWNPMDPITEDLEQEGYLLILESLKTYDKNQSVHFLHYIKIKILYFYKNYYRKIKNENRNIKFEEKLYTESSLDSILKKEIINELLLNIQKLSPKEQKVIYLYYYEQMPMKEIPINLNIPYRTCIGRKYCAIKKLKKYMHTGR